MKLGAPLSDERELLLQGGQFRVFCAIRVRPLAIERAQGCQRLVARSFERRQHLTGFATQRRAFAGEQRASERPARGIPRFQKRADPLRQCRLAHEEIAERHRRRGREHNFRRIEFQQMPHARSRVAEHGKGGVERDKTRAIAAAGDIRMQRRAEPVKGILERGDIQPGPAWLIEGGEVIGHLWEMRGLRARAASLFSNETPPGGVCGYSFRQTVRLAHHPPPAFTAHRMIKTTAGNLNAMPHQDDRPLQTMHARLIPGPQARAALLSLVLASALCMALVAVRGFYSQKLAFTSFLWNLFLAWVPVMTAVPIYALRARDSKRPVLLVILAILWFLFFPNAAYIITDIQHLYRRPGVPYWFDMIMIMSFALTGWFLGYLSLYLVQEVVRGWLGRVSSWVFALGMLALSSFGIYLGRFLRWNSWDALLAPIATISDAARVAHPVNNPQALAFSATFFAFSLVCYLIVYSFTHLHAWVERTPVPDAHKR